MTTLWWTRLCVNAHAEFCIIRMRKRCPQMVNGCDQVCAVVPVACTQDRALIRMRCFAICACANVACLARGGALLSDHARSTSLLSNLRVLQASSSDFLLVVKLLKKENTFLGSTNDCTAV